MIPTIQQRSTIQVFGISQWFVHKFQVDWIFEHFFSILVRKCIFLFEINYFSNQSTRVSSFYHDR